MTLLFLKSETTMENNETVKGQPYYDEDYLSAVGSTEPTSKTFNRDYSSASYNTYLNYETNVHVKSEYNKDDYYRFRPTEKILRDHKRIIKMCMDAYDNVGIIKNTVDLMSDFGCKGIRIVHKNRAVQNFLRKWFKFVNGTRVTERILNNLYKTGNVIIEKIDGKITRKAAEKWSKAFDTTTVEARVIPKNYIIHNPLSIEKIGSLVITERPLFFLRVTDALKDEIGLLAQYGKSIQLDVGRDGVKQLKPENVFDYYYKKDDWEKWAKPMTFAVMNELMMLDKIQLADMSALDGAISNIRLWTLGDLEHGIYPNRAGIDKLRGILAKNVGGGVMDLVWGPELKFQESNTQVHNFLGKEKYEAILTLIYAGLGIPPTLTGSSSASGFTNNFISLKTLVERLQYGRDIINDFWSKQLEQVIQAMGFTGQAKVIFTYNVLADESAEKALLIDLWDRDLLTSESIRDAFGFDPDVEGFKLNREARTRGKSSPRKASPYHNPQTDHDLMKIFAQSGGYAPSDFGLSLVNKSNIAPVKLQPEKEYKGTPPEGGRPKNSKDSYQRDRKAKIRRTAIIDNMIKYSKAQEELSEKFNPIFLQSVGKDSLRHVSKEEYLSLERIKFGILSNTMDLSDESILKACELPFQGEDIVRAFVEDYTEENGKKPSIEEMKQIYCVSLAINALGDDDAGER